MIFNAIAELIAERNECDIAEIQPDTKLADLGIDSLDTVEMLMNLEDKIGMEVELEEKVETVG
ncbi:MAG: acyl carrier protein, partial [Oscillospiraceae bacterium]|nr:acyl carrier protein [Oscillospiraceae bacterium]